MRRIMATTIIALAAVTVAPAYAQQVDAQTKQAAEAISAKWIEAGRTGPAKIRARISFSINLQRLGRFYATSGIPTMCSIVARHVNAG